MVLARCSRAARLKSGFLNCISGARSAYFGTRRWSAAGTVPGLADVGRGLPDAGGTAGDQCPEAFQLHVLTVPFLRPG